MLAVSTGGKLVCVCLKKGRFWPAVYLPALSLKMGLIPLKWENEIHTHTSFSREYKYTDKHSVFGEAGECDAVSSVEYFPTFRIIVVPSYPEFSSHSWTAWHERWKYCDLSKLRELLASDTSHPRRGAKRTSNLCCTMLTGDLCKDSYCRHWDSAHWRHRVLAQQTGRATASQRHHGMTGKNELPHRRTTGLFRSSQWGSATVPYKGAKVNVPVLSGNKKASFVAASSAELLPCSRVVIQMPIP